MVAVVHSAQRTAGWPAPPCPPGDRAWLLIATVSDCKETADRFVRDALMASMPVEGGFEGQPEERAAEVSKLETT